MFVLAQYLKIMDPSQCSINNDDNGDNHNCSMVHLKIPYIWKIKWNICN